MRAESPFSPYTNEEIQFNPSASFVEFDASKETPEMQMKKQLFLEQLMANIKNGRSIYTAIKGLSIIERLSIIETIENSEQENEDANLVETILGSLQQEQKPTNIHLLNKIENLIKDKAPIQENLTSDNLKTILYEIITEELKLSGISDSDIGLVQNVNSVKNLLNYKYKHLKISYEIYNKLEDNIINNKKEIEYLYSDFSENIANLRHEMDAYSHEIAQLDTHINTHYNALKNLSVLIKDYNIISAQNIVYADIKNVIEEIKSINVDVAANLEQIKNYEKNEGEIEIKVLINYLKDLQNLLSNRISNFKKDKEDHRRNINNLGIHLNHLYEQQNNLKQNGLIGFNLQNDNALIRFDFKTDYTGQHSYCDISFNKDAESKLHYFLSEPFELIEGEFAGADHYQRLARFETIKGTTLAQRYINNDILNPLQISDQGAILNNAQIEIGVKFLNMLLDLNKAINKEYYDFNTLLTFIATGGGKTTMTHKAFPGITVACSKGSINAFQKDVLSNSGIHIACLSWIVMNNYFNNQDVKNYSNEIKKINLFCSQQLINITHAIQDLVGLENVETELKNNTISSYEKYQNLLSEIVDKLLKNELFETSSITICIQSISDQIIQTQYQLNNISNDLQSKLETEVKKINTIQEKLSAEIKILKKDIEEYPQVIIGLLNLNDEIRQEESINKPLAKLFRSIIDNVISGSIDTEECINNIYQGIYAIFQDIHRREPGSEEKDDILMITEVIKNQLKTFSDRYNDTIEHVEDIESKIYTIENNISVVQEKIRFNQENLDNINNINNRIVEICQSQTFLNLDSEGQKEVASICNLQNKDATPKLFTPSGLIYVLNNKPELLADQIICFDEYDQLLENEESSALLAQLMILCAAYNIKLVLASATGHDKYQDFIRNYLREYIQTNIDYCQTIQDKLYNQQKERFEQLLTNALEDNQDLWDQYCTQYFLQKYELSLATRFNEKKAPSTKVRIRKEGDSKKNSQHLLDAILSDFLPKKMTADTYLMPKDKQFSKRDGSYKFRFGGTGLYFTSYNDIQNDSMAKKMELSDSGAIWFIIKAVNSAGENADISYEDFCKIFNHHLDDTIKTNPNYAIHFTKVKEKTKQIMPLIYRFNKYLQKAQTDQEINDKQMCDILHSILNTRQADGVPSYTHLGISAAKAKKTTEKLLEFLHYRSKEKVRLVDKERSDFIFQKLENEYFIFRHYTEILHDSRNAYETFLQEMQNTIQEVQEFKRIRQNLTIEGCASVDRVIATILQRFIKECAEKALSDIKANIEKIRFKNLDENLKSSISLIKNSISNAIKACNQIIAIDIDNAKDNAIEKFNHALSLTLNQLSVNIDTESNFTYAVERTTNFTRSIEDILTSDDNFKNKTFSLANEFSRLIEDVGINSQLDVAHDSLNYQEMLQFFSKKISKKIANIQKTTKELRPQFCAELNSELDTINDHLQEQIQNKSQFFNNIYEANRKFTKKILKSNINPDDYIEIFSTPLWLEKLPKNLTESSNILDFFDYKKAGENSTLQISMNGLLNGLLARYIAEHIASFYRQDINKLHLDMQNCTGDIFKFVKEHLYTDRLASQEECTKYISDAVNKITNFIQTGTISQTLIQHTQEISDSRVEGSSNFPFIHLCKKTNLTGLSRYDKNNIHIWVDVADLGTEDFYEVNQDVKDFMDFIKEGDLKKITLDQFMQTLGRILRSGNIRSFESVALSNLTLHIFNKGRKIGTYDAEKLSKGENYTQEQWENSSKKQDYRKIVATQLPTQKQLMITVDPLNKLHKTLKNLNNANPGKTVGF